MFAAVLALLGARTVRGQSLTVTPGSAGPITVTTAFAGQDPAPVSTSGGTYRLVQRRNRGVGRITARLAAPLPSGTMLTIQLASPGGTAQSAGPVQLNTTAQAVVTNIPNRNVTFGSQPITYTLAATSAAGVVPLQSVNVIFELAP